MDRTPDYSFMRTGLAAPVEPARPRWSAEDWSAAQAMLLIFTEDSMVMAKQYARMRGHPEATTGDILDCLKAKTREGLATSPNVEARMREYREVLDGEEELSSSSSEDEDAASTEARAEHLALQLDPEVTEAYSMDESFVARVQEYVRGWDTWEPQTDVEAILKSAVNNTQSAFNA